MPRRVYLPLPAINSLRSKSDPYFISYAEKVILGGAMVTKLLGLDPGPMGATLYSVPSQ